VAGPRASALSACASARPTPPAAGAEEIPGSDYESKADMVIKALGFDPEDLPAHFAETALSVNRWGGVKVDYRSMMTTMDGVFAAGDISARRIGWWSGRSRRAATPPPD